MGAIALARWAVVAYMVGIPFLSLHVDDYGAHDLSRLAQLPLFAWSALALLLVVVFGPGSPRPPMALGAKVVLGVVGLLAFGSIAGAAQPTQAMREACLMLGMGAVAAVFAQGAIRDAGRAHAVVLVFGTTAYALVVVLTIVAGALSGGQPQHWTAAAFFGYDSFRFYNHVQTLALPLCALVASLTPLHRVVRVLAWTGLVLGFALVFVCASRATGLAMLLAASIAALACGRTGRRLAATLTVGAALGAIVFGIMCLALPAAAPKAPGVPELTGDGARFYLWRLAIGYAIESPWTGIGPMHYAHRMNPEGAHPHNAFLQIAAEWGVPLFVLLCAWAGWALWRFGRRFAACPQSGLKQVGCGLFLACIAVLVDGAFSGNLVMPVSQIWIAVLVGASTAWYRRAGLDASARPHRVENGSVGGAMPARKPGIRLAVATLLLASQLWLIHDVSPEIAGLSARLAALQAETPSNARTNPRFWSHGWF